LTLHQHIDKSLKIFLSFFKRGTIMSAWHLVKTAALALSFTSTTLALAETDVASCEDAAVKAHAFAVEQAASYYQAELPLCYDRLVNSTRAETLLCIKNAELDRREAVKLADIRLEMALSDCPNQL
jgi:hypothetical protein